MISNYAENLLIENGYEGVIFLTNPSYDDAILGVSINNCVVYDYHMMVEWLVRNEGFSEEEATDYIDYNTIRALPYMGEGAPIIVNSLI